MVYLLTELRPPLVGKYAIKHGPEGLPPDFLVLDAPVHWEMREREGVLQVHTESGWATFGDILARRRTWPAMCLTLFSSWSLIYGKMCLVIGPTEDCYRDMAAPHV